MQTKIVVLNNEHEQLALGACLAQACDNKGACIFLQGDLGMGKTTLARGFLQGLGYTGKIKSPTYPLIELYTMVSRTVLHIDLYRIQSADEVAMLGIADQLDENTLCLIEWAEKAKQELPPPDLTCYIAPFANGRQLTFVAMTSRGQDILTAMVARWVN